MKKMLKNLLGLDKAKFAVGSTPIHEGEKVVGVESIDAPNTIMRASDGTEYQADVVTRDGLGKVDSATMRKVNERRRPAGMSPRQWRNTLKAERRLERHRRQQLLERARTVDERDEVAEAIAEHVTPAKPEPRFPWRTVS